MRLELTYMYVRVLMFFTNNLSYIQSALRHTFAWKTGSEMHFAVSRNIMSWLHHNHDVMY